MSEASSYVASLSRLAVLATCAAVTNLHSAEAVERSTQPDGWFTVSHPKWNGAQFRSPSESPGSCRKVAQPGNVTVPDGICEYTSLSGGVLWSSVGRLANGIESGHFVESCCNGTKKFEGSYELGARNGFGVVYDNGLRWAGPFVNGEMHGDGIFYRRDGSSYPQTRVNGKPVSAQSQVASTQQSSRNRCAECRENVEFIIEREARKLSKMYAQPCAEQGYQACRRVAEERYRRSSVELGDSDWDCSKLCAAESGANSGPDYAAIADCRGQVQDELNRLTSERQKCYGAVIGNPANVFSCKEIDSRIDMLQRQRDNCDMNPEQGTLSASKSRQTDSNIQPPQARSGAGGSGSAAGCTDGRYFNADAGRWMNCETSPRGPDVPSQGGGKQTETEYSEASCTGGTSNGICLKYSCPSGWDFTRVGPVGQSVPKCFRTVYK